MNARRDNGRINQRRGNSLEEGMAQQPTRRARVAILAVVGVACVLAGCARGIPAERLTTAEGYDYDYIVGPGDTLNVFVWGVPDLSQEAAAVRPDGRISLPLVEDLTASGKTPTQLSREIEQSLRRYVREPLVTVLVGGRDGKFRGVYDTQIRVIGEVISTNDGGTSGGTGAGLTVPQPQAIPYTRNMTLIDVMVEVGGLTRFAAGNRAKLVRTVDGQQQQYRLRLQDLIEDGDLSANVKMAPGDIVVVPTAWF